MFTFQTKLLGSDDWTTSSRRCLTHDEARRYAIEWADVMLMNDEAVTVRIIKLDDSVKQSPIA